MRRLLIPVALVAALLPGLQESKPDAGPKVGKPAPTARLNDHNGEVVAIGGAQEHWSILAFFPKAATPG